MGGKISSIRANFASKWWEICLQIVDNLVPICYIKYPVGKTANNVEISRPNDGIIRSDSSHTIHNWSNHDPTVEVERAGNFSAHELVS